MGGIAGTPWSLCRRIAVVAVSVITLALSANALGRQATDQDPALVFGADAGVVLTFVVPDRSEDFERVLDHLRQVLEQSEDPIRRQQAEHWRVFHSSDPGPNGSVLYVSFMEPVLKGADYNIAHILEDELPEHAAEELVGAPTATPAQPQSTLNLDAILDLENWETP